MKLDMLGLEGRSGSGILKPTCIRLCWGWNGGVGVGYWNLPVFVYVGAGTAEWEKANRRI